jgi:hypothetical protein
MNCRFSAGAISDGEQQAPRRWGAVTQDEAEGCNAKRLISAEPRVCPATIRRMLNRGEPSRRHAVGPTAEPD